MAALRLRNVNAGAQFGGRAGRRMTGSASQPGLDDRSPHDGIGSPPRLIATSGARQLPGPGCTRSSWRGTVLIHSERGITVSGAPKPERHTPQLRGLPGIGSVQRQLTAQELKRIVARHLGWLAKNDPEGLPKHDTYLEEVEPIFLEWQHEALNSPQMADLRYTELPDANLTGANLTDANLSYAFLFGAILSGANLRGVDFTNSALGKARLNKANLTGARLSWADLTDADLTGADLTKARLDYTNLRNAIYSPASGPPDPYVAGIRGLSAVRVQQGTAYDAEVGLVQLRKLLRDLGLRNSEREATYSIERYRTSKRLAAYELRPSELWSRFRGVKRPGALPAIDLITKTLPDFFAGIFRQVAFDWTTHYGLHPFRALFVIMGIWLLCVPVYCWSIVHPGQSQQGSGIYRILPANRIGGPEATPAIQKDPAPCRIQSASWLEAIPPAAYFSLLSAVNIGFQQFTPGDWIRRLQPHDYILQPEGWVRVVAGGQALLSVFLLAMWVLTQFGRPFE